MTTKKAAEKKATPKNIDFEAAMQKLQNTVRDLESGDLPLEDALKRFEEGVRLTRDCHQFLQDAEKKIELLTGKNSDGSPVLESFDSPNDSRSS